MFFVLFIVKNFFINQTCFFLEQKLFLRIQFPNTIFYYYFLKTQNLFFKTILKNYFPVFKNSNQTYVHEPDDGRIQTIGHHWR